MKTILKHILPKWMMSWYHRTLALASAFVYRHPSEKMVVIGVTGTNGKSTVVNVLSRLLEDAGYVTGFMTTLNFKVAKKEWVNDKKMTMLGRFQLQKMLRDMVSAGCTHAIVETSSEGIAQWRHYGVNYDVAVLTNLTPEHIESHGSFENYKRAKGKLFSHLTLMPHKTIGGKKIQKQIVLNADDEHADYFLQFPADRTFGFSLRKGTPLLISPLNEGGEMRASDVSVRENGSSFMLNGNAVTTQLLGMFNVQNVVCAMVIATAIGVPLEQVARAVPKIPPVPGRLEFIRAGQSFAVVVDYAYEPAALEAVFDFLKHVEKKRVIHIVGSAGGGRDVARRDTLGRMSSAFADSTIVANEDPYDEDPINIINDVAAGAVAAGSVEGKNLFKILDRREAIRRAVSLAREGDLVLITGKGAEPVMAVAQGKKIPWDDRVVVREELARIGYNKKISHLDRVRRQEGT